MATNPIGPNTKNLNVNMPIELRHKLDELAARSGMKLSAYVRMVLDKAARHETTYRIEEIQKSEKAAESSRKYATRSSRSKK